MLNVFSLHVARFENSINLLTFCGRVYTNRWQYLIESNWRCISRSFCHFLSITINYSIFISFIVSWYQLLFPPFYLLLLFIEKNSQCRPRIWEEHWTGVESSCRGLWNITGGYCAFIPELLLLSWRYRISTGSSNQHIQDHARLNWDWV